MSSDAKAVCETLNAAGFSKVNAGVVHMPSVRSEQMNAQEVRAEFRRLQQSEAAMRVAFYTGHGDLDDTPTGRRLYLRSASDRRSDLEANELPKLLDDPEGQPITPGATVLFLNACDSGYVELRGVRRPTVVIGSGYGTVDPTAPRGATNGATSEPHSRFGMALREALGGAADGPPLGNCDGTVTDQEAAEYLNEQLGEMALRAEQSVDDWGRRPLAAIKRNVDWHIPIAWPGRPANCPQGVPSDALDELQQVTKAAEIYRRPLNGNWIPPSGPRRFLLLSAARSELPTGGAETPGAAVKALHDVMDSLLTPLAWTVVDASHVDMGKLVEGARAVSFLEIEVLRIRESAYSSDDLYLELLRPRDETVTWAELVKQPTGDATRALAIRIAQRLRKRTTLLGVGAVSLLWSTVPLPPSGTLDRVRWSDLGSQASKVAFPIAGLQAAPCPGGIGQCLLLTQRPAIEEPHEWTFLP